MNEIETTIADVEARWETATPGERTELVDRLRSAEVATPDLDDATRTRIAALVHRIEADRGPHGADAAAPPPIQGTGFGVGQTALGRLDLPDR